MKRKAPTRKRLRGSVAVLDIGSSKIACLIAEVAASGEVSVVGIGHQLSKGLRAGVVTDLAEAQASIISAVSHAEEMAGIAPVEQVLVSLTGTHVGSRTVSVELDLAGEEVSDRDVVDIAQEARAQLSQIDVEIIHSLPLSYTLDGAQGISDPRGMFGRRLGADVHLMCANAGVLSNLEHCINRCHLNVAGYVVAPYASAIACLEEDERQLGVLMVDMGGATTSLAVYAGGKVLYTDTIPIGGHHVTSDIARGLSTSLAHAERLKTLHGSAIASASDGQVMLDIQALGEEEGTSSSAVARAMLVGIIRPRIEELFEMIRSHVEVSGLSAVAGKRVVLTGGASQLLGVREVAASVLGKQARLARPKTISGLADSVSGPAFSSVIGMVSYATRRTAEDPLYELRKKRSSWLDKISGWLRESF